MQKCKEFPQYRHANVPMMFTVLNVVVQPLQSKTHWSVGCFRTEILTPVVIVWKCTIVFGPSIRVVEWAPFSLEVYVSTSYPPVVDLWCLLWQKQRLLCFLWQKQRLHHKSRGTRCGSHFIKRTCSTLNNGMNKHIVVSIKVTSPQNHPTPTSSVLCVPHYHWSPRSKSPQSMVEGTVQICYVMDTSMTILR